MKKYRTRSGLAMSAGLAALSAAQIGGPAMETRYIVECRGGDGKLKWVESFCNRVVNSGLDDLLDKYFKGSAYTASHFVGLIGAGTGTVAINSGTAGVTGTGTSFTAADATNDILIVGAGGAGVDLATTVLSQSSGTTITLSANASATVSGAAYALEPRAADVMNSKSFNESTAYSNATRPALTLGAVAGQSVNNSANRAQFDINANGTRIFGAFVATNNTKGGTSGVLYGGGLFSASRLLNNGDLLFVTVTLTASAT